VSADALLDVRDLSVAFGQGEKAHVVVDRVSFALRRGQTLALVGESGSGKSVTALSIMRLIEPPGRIVDGEVLLDGQDLMRADERAMERIRGARIGMVFQDPLTSLNPALTIGSQIAETILAHETIGNAEAFARGVRLLEHVGVADAAQRARDYPHHFSGGMRQRALIALALALEPDLLVADEPTTALDLTVQAQIVWLLEQIQQRARMGLIFITHNLALAGTISHRIAVMYAGWIVEIAPTAEMLRHPAHPYAQGLIASVPAGHWRERRIRPIPGHAPVGVADAPGCPFMPRCARATAACGEAMPPPREVAPGHVVRCVHAG